MERLHEWGAWTAPSDRNLAAGLHGRLFLLTRFARLSIASALVVPNSVMLAAAMPHEGRDTAKHHKGK